MSHYSSRKMNILRNLPFIVVSSESKAGVTTPESLLFQLRGNGFLIIFSQFPSWSYFCSSSLTLSLRLHFFLVYLQEGHTSRHKIHWSSSFAAPMLDSTNCMPINPRSLFIHPSPTRPTGIFTCQQGTINCTSLHHHHTKSPLVDMSPQRIISTNL